MIKFPVGEIGDCAKCAAVFKTSPSAELLAECVAELRRLQDVVGSEDCAAIQVVLDKVRRDVGQSETKGG